MTSFQRNTDRQIMTVCQVKAELALQVKKGSGEVPNNQSRGGSTSCGGELEHTKSDALRIKGSPRFTTRATNQPDGYHKAAQHNRIQNCSRFYCFIESPASRNCPALFVQIPQRLPRGGRQRLGTQPGAREGPRSPHAVEDVRLAVGLFWHLCERVVVYQRNMPVL